MLVVIKSISYQHPTVPTIAEHTEIQLQIQWWNTYVPMYNGLKVVESTPFGNQTGTFSTQRHKDSSCHLFGAIYT